MIDHSFALVDRALGKLDAPVRQGVYKVKVRLADATAEQLVVLNSDTEVDLTAELPLASAAPLVGSSQTHEFHMYPAVARSDHVAVNVGVGAEIFLCARRWRGPDAHVAAPGPQSIPSLSLHRPDGGRLAELEVVDGGLDRPDEPLVAKTIGVDPGSYMLRRVDSFGDEIEQTVQAVRDWQIQVFLLEEETRVGDAQATGLEVKDQQVSILMGRDRFDPADPTLRLVEQARAALADERNVASSFVSETLFAKFDNPMLGLFGAHLMLIGRDAAEPAEEAEPRSSASAKRRVRAPADFDQSLFDHVVSNLTRLLGPDHPDAIALATQTSDRHLTDLEPVAVPPMLWRSWRLLIEASNQRPDLVPVETWRRTLGVVPTRPFFAWSPEHAADAAVNEWGREVRKTLQGGRAGEPKRDIPLGLGAIRGVRESRTAKASPDLRQRLTTELLAPRAVIDQVAGDQLG